MSPDKTISAAEDYPRRLAVLRAAHAPPPVPTPARAHLSAFSVINLSPPAVETLHMRPLRKLGAWRASALPAGARVRLATDAPASEAGRLARVCAASGARVRPVITLLPPTSGTVLRWGQADACHGNRLLIGALRLRGAARRSHRARRGV